MKNRVYLGEARSGDFVKEGAHDPLVTPALWKRIQRRLQKGSYVDPNRERAILAGVCRCATCGGTLTQDSTRRNGKVYPFYRCKSQARCTAKATIGRDKLEGHVIAWVGERFRVDGTRPVTPDTSHLQAAVDAAEDELAAYVTATSAAQIGPALFARDSRSARARSTTRCVCSRKRPRSPPPPSPSCCGRSTRRTSRRRVHRPDDRVGGAGSRPARWAISRP